MSRSQQYARWLLPQRRVPCFGYHLENRHARTPTWHETDASNGRWRAYFYSELVARDKASLDVFRLRGNAVEPSANLPAPDVIAVAIVEDVRAALATFEALQPALTLQ